MSKGTLFVLLSPSGGGKGSVMKELLETEKKLRCSVSATTRKPRPGEIDGRHYFFMDRAGFEGMIEKGTMLEHAQYCGNYYGTPKAAVEKWQNDGLDVILEIEVQGAVQVKRLAADAVSIFIMPPSFEILENRLRRRGTETEEVIASRLKAARDEIAYAQSCDYIVVNDKLQDAVDDVRAIIRASRCRIENMRDFVKGVQENA